MPTPRLARTLPFALVLVAAGCGPALIGVGVASAGGGGGGGGPQAPTIEGQRAGDQPEDARTELRFVVKQADGRPVRASLSVASAAGGGGIPAQHLTFDRSVQDIGGDTFVLPSSKDGVAYVVKWDHEAHLGRREVRDVTVTVAYRDSERTEDVVKNEQIYGRETVGRRNAEVETPLRLSRAGDAESAIVIEGTHSDEGDDLGITEFSLRYAFERDMGGAPIWSTPMRVSPTSSGRRFEGANNERVVHDLRLELNPIDLQIPFGTVEFLVQLDHQERFTTGTRFPKNPTSLLIGQAVGALDPTTIGRAPVIQEVAFADPDSNFASADQPRFQLPLRVRIFNPSSQTVRVRFDGEYSVNSGGRRVMTFTRDGAPGTEREIELQPAETRKHVVIWNVLADEGLGIRPLDNQLARAFLQAVVVAPAAGTPLRSNQQASEGTIVLSTNPFVDFRETLLPEADRLVSAGIAETARTRDIFYTVKRTDRRGSMSFQEYEFGVDQSFSPIRIPNLMPFRTDRTGFPNGGIGDLFPTDFIADAPDLIVRIENNFYFAEWPPEGNSGPREPLEQLPAPGGGQRRGRGSFTFRARTLTGDAPGFFFFSYDDLGTNREATVHLKALVRNGTQWFGTNQAVTKMLPTQGGDNLSYQIVGGNFDDDDATTELVVGNPGVEFATMQETGWLHLFRLEPDDNGRITFQETGPLPGVLTDPDPTRRISKWLLTSWVDPRNPGHPGLLLSRTFDGTTSEPQEHMFDALMQQPGGGFVGSTWQRVARITSGSIILDTRGELATDFVPELFAVFARDLDSGLGGSPEAELVCVFGQNRRRLNPPEADALAVYLSVPLRAGGRAWRRASRVLQTLDQQLVGNDQYFLGANTALVDVNGDDFLDLVVQEGRDPNIGPRTPIPATFWYIPSSLTGVAGGFTVLQDINRTPLNPSQLPGVSDFNRDGLGDVLSAGVLYLGRVEGGLGTGETGGFSGNGVGVRYSVEQVLPGAGTTAHVNDVVAVDPTRRLLTVQPFGFNTENPPRVVPGVAVAVDFTGTAQDVRGLLPPGRDPDTETRDLALTVGDGLAVHELHRGTFNGTRFVATRVAEVTEPLVRDLVTLRKGTIPAGADPARNTLPQDIVVGITGTNRLVVLRADANYARSEVTVGSGGEQLLRIAAAPVTDDGREDVMALTFEGDVMRLWCMPQAADGSIQAGILFLQFDAPVSEARGMGFHRAAGALGHGIVLLRDTVRFVLPSIEGGGVRAGMIRSSLSTPIDADLGLALNDFDGDGQVEVIGGETTKVLKVDRAYRQ